MPKDASLTLDARLKMLEEQIDVGTWTADSDLKELTWSPGLFRLLGFDVALVRPSIDLMRSIVHPEDRPAFEGLLSFSQVRSTSKRVFRIIRADGTQHYLLAKAQAHFTREGDRRFLFGVFVDFTADAEALERSKLTSAHLSVAAHLLGGHPWITDSMGKLLDSAHWEAMTGLRIQNATDWSERLTAIHPNDQGNFGEAWKSAISNLVPFVGTFRLRMPDDSYQAYSNRAEPVFSDGGKLLYWVGHSVPIATADPVLTASGFGAAHIRAARGFLDWSAHELAEKSGIPYGTIRRIEDGSSEAKHLHIQVLVHTFAQHGIEFFDQHDGKINIATPKYRNRAGNSTLASEG